MGGAPDDGDVGAQLRNAREAAGLSLSSLAAKVPYSRSALGHFETGVRRPTADVVSWYGACLAPRSTP